MLVFSALADPTRRRIVELLAQGELSAGEVAARFAMSRPAVSQHLRVLRDAGLVRSRAEAQRRVYSIDPAGLAEVDDWVVRQREFWAARLSTLEEAVRSSTDKTRRRT
ncbi:MAG: ArsR/SmtB family transcription factor [Nocardioidaceae bacterium]